MRKVIVIISSFFVSSAKSQSKLDSLLDKLDPQKFAASVCKKAEKLEDKLVMKSILCTKNIVSILSYT